jgi:hypothetical protein
MPHQPNWKYVEECRGKADCDSVVDLYDKHYGSYADPADPTKRAQPDKPSTNPAPFRVTR